MKKNCEKMYTDGIWYRPNERRIPTACDQRKGQILLFVKADSAKKETQAPRDDILDFIKRRFSKDCDWTNGNCYWFAKILCMRFNGLYVYYLPAEGHFVASDGVYLYDATGVKQTAETAILLAHIRKDDPLWYQHLMRDCFE